MEERGTWKVGLITILAVLGVFGMLAFLVPRVHDMLTGGRWDFYIVFDDAGGLQPAEKVTLAGVDIGDVKTVDLIARPDSKGALLVKQFESEHGLRPHALPFALVRVGIQKPYAGQLYNFYRYEVGSSSLIGSTHEVSITPAAPVKGQPPAPDVLHSRDVVFGSAAMSLTSLAGPASNMMSAVTDLTNKMRDLVADPRLKGQLLASLDQVHAAATNMRDITDQARTITATTNTKLQRSLDQNLGNVQATTANFREASAKVNRSLDSNLANVQATTANFRDASAQLPALLAQVREPAADAMRNIDATTSKVKTFVADSGTLDDLHATVANFKQGSEKLNGIVDKINTLASRPEFQQDIPQIVKNLKDASAELAPTIRQARETLASVKTTSDAAGGAISAVRGAVGKNNPNARKQGAPPHQPLGLQSGIGFLYSRKTSDRFSHSGLVDPEYEIHFGPNSYYLGLYDIGGENRLNAQIGRRLVGTDVAGLRLRYGLYRGLAGTGLDYIFSPKLGLYATAYDPNLPSVDLESIFDLTDNYALWGGIDELNRSHPRPVLGVRLLTK